MEQLKQTLLELKGFSETNFSNFSKYRLEYLPTFENQDPVKVIKEGILANNKEDISDIFLDIFDGVSDEARDTYAGFLGEILYTAFSSASDDEMEFFWEVLLRITKKEDLLGRKVHLVGNMGFSQNFKWLIRSHSRELCYGPSKRLKSIFSKTGKSVEWKNILRANDNSSFSISKINELAIQLKYPYFMYGNKLYIAGSESFEETAIRESEIK